MIDAARPWLPSELGCVIDEARTSDAVAVGWDPHVGATMVIITRAFASDCPALSKLGPDRYVATIGGGALADRKSSVVVDPQWARSREYLLHDPLAIAAELPGWRMIAVAQPEPLDGWVAIDATNPTEVEKGINELVARWRSNGNTVLANKLRNTRKGAQVLVRVDKLDENDLVALATDLLRTADDGHLKTPVSFTCPPVDGVVKGCTDGRALTVASVRDVLRDMTGVDMVPVVSGGGVVGLRLVRDAPRLLRAGDIILGIDNRRVTTKDQLAALGESPGKKIAVAIRRDGIDTVLTLSE